MDYHLKAWRNQPQSEHLPSAKIPRLLESLHQPSGSALSLFVPEPHNRIGNLSAFPDPVTTTSRFGRMGGFFSLAQWQELELQALIFKYMLAGTAVPAELLQPIEKSFLSTPACYFQQSQYFQPDMLQSGYWGRTVDPEPDRCRRTDGKKWRCSRDVVAGQKYCERHVHRGRNRSRKPVEMSTQATEAASSALKTTSLIAASPITAVACGTNFTISGSSPSIDLPFNQRSSESRHENERILESHINKVASEESADGRILRHFFDDWPRSQQEANIASSNASRGSSTTCLSISDFSLKLSTGNVDELGPREEDVGGGRTQLNWEAGWATQQVSSMGGPLAEALRASTSNSSPTSVLHELRHGSGSETSSQHLNLS